MTVDTGRGLVMIPTYNEAQTLGHAIERLLDADNDVHILVVDDASPDGTAAIAKAAAVENDGRIHVLERTGKRGLGSAYVDGYRWGLEHGYGAMVEMDADGSHDPAVVPRLLAALSNADMAIGSRYVPGGGVHNWSRSRRALSAAGNVYARVLLGIKIKDATSGFRAIRSPMVRRLLEGKVRSEGYAFQIEITRRVRNLGGRTVEVPIIFDEREAGTSKMSKRIVAEAIVSVTAWGLKDAAARLMGRLPR
jgi:dolichol-phosphate mannosyltransferase